MGVSAPSMGGMPGGAMPGPGGPAGGPSSLELLQQVQSLLAQIAQQEPEPEIQRGVATLLQAVDPLMQVLGTDQGQDLSSGLSNPSGPPGGAAGPDLAGGDLSSRGSSATGGGEPQSFGGAKKAAMANFKEKGHFSKSGSKGEKLQTDKQKNRK